MRGRGGYGGGAAVRAAAHADEVMHSANAVGKVASDGVQSTAQAGARAGGDVAPEVAHAAAKATNVQDNAAKGAAYEAKVVEDLARTQTGVVQQVTVKTQSGVKTRVDVVGTDSSGALKLTEAKSSPTAPLTPNQKAAFPEIAESGAIVVGQGKPGVPGGTVIPPTTVDVVRQQ